MNIGLEFILQLFFSVKGVYLGTHKLKILIQNGEIFAR